MAFGFVVFHCSINCSKMRILYFLVKNWVENDNFFWIYTKSIRHSSSIACEFFNHSRCLLFFAIASLHRSSINGLLRKSRRCFRADNSFSICFDASLSRLLCSNVTFCSKCFLFTLSISFRISKSKQEHIKNLQIILLTA